MSTDPAVTAHVDSDAFRNVVSHFASGVTVITTCVYDKDYGTTASAVTSLSVEPPMMLICLNTSSTTHDRIAKSGIFGINILAAGQSELASHFSRKGDDKFSGVAHHRGARGVPLLDGALATMVCTVAETALGGTHTVFLSHVIEANAADGEPLAYYRGAFGHFERARERAVYEAARAFILRRQVPLHSHIDITAAATELGFESGLVHNALVALETEGLVYRVEAGEFTPTPLTVPFVESLYDGRATIEIGVIETWLETASDTALNALAEVGDALVAMTDVQEASIADFLDQHKTFHEKIVALAGSPQLTQAYRRLTLSPVWRQTLDNAVWPHYQANGLIAALVDAMQRRDTTDAKIAVNEFTTYFKDAARESIQSRGGSI
jgi:4-nitrophenol 2-monooxygenase / 4-nitrocatechol 4-monooxygenase, reductase component